MPLKGLVLLALLATSPQGLACGGFFCDFVPIDQAGEQIIFRQQDGETTAMIKIDYVGNAEDFGWVLPVPEAPLISLGSDITFTELELNTRPQFLLERVGQACQIAVPANNSSVPVVFSSSASSSPSSVTIEQTLSVGPFDALVVSSDDPQALAQWLDENNLDLTDRGSELLAPYIQAKSKFVVLKLKNNANVGSIQPIILKYKSSTPVIPMTLTAVAAQDNMGVLVWLLGNGRGVPKNFKHVTPNYTRLNWFSSNRSAYASYQTLITQAMDEAGGQGFATDFAGLLPNLVEQLTTAQGWTARLAGLESASDAKFIAEIWDTFDATAQQSVRAALPTSNAFVYAQPLTMAEVFTQEQLAQARSQVFQDIDEQIITPLANAIDILDDDLYMTRLYTTLSADEMTVNPEFTFNTAMEGQSLTRNATLTASCTDGQSEWTLKLGKGTGRDDELVIEGWQPVPFRAVATEQQASWRVEKTSATANPVLLAENKFQVLSLGEKPVELEVEDPSKKKGGSLNLLMLWVLSLGLLLKNPRCCKD